jgi:hypothetical protein
MVGLPFLVFGAVASGIAYKELSRTQSTATLPFSLAAGLMAGLLGAWLSLALGQHYHHRAWGSFLACVVALGLTAIYEALRVSVEELSSSHRDVLHGR